MEFNPKKMLMPRKNWHREMSMSKEYEKINEYTYGFLDLNI
jgi:hypothetical protein